MSQPDILSFAQHASAAQPRPPVPFIDLREQHQTIRDEVMQAVTRVFDSQHFILGEELSRFETECAGIEKRLQTDRGLLTQRLLFSATRLTGFWGVYVGDPVLDAVEPERITIHDARCPRARCAQGEGCGNGVFRRHGRPAVGSTYHDASERQYKHPWR